MEASACARLRLYDMNFPAILSNYNGMTAYICRRFIPTTAFLVLLNVFSQNTFP